MKGSGSSWIEFVDIRKRLAKNPSEANRDENEKQAPAKTNTFSSMYKYSKSTKNESWA